MSITNFIMWCCIEYLIGGGNRSRWGNTMSITNFIIWCCIEYPIGGGNRSRWKNTMSITNFFMWCCIEYSIAKGNQYGLRKPLTIFITCFRQDGVPHFQFSVFCFRPVSCVPNVVSSSGLSIPDSYRPTTIHGEKKRKISYHIVMYCIHDNVDE
jgi:hypothetical protein